MPYIADINPFKGVLCATYYHIWIVIAISWIPLIMKSIWNGFMQKYYNYKLYDTWTNLETEIYIELRERFIQELEEIKINGIYLPRDIISVMMEMLPETSDDDEEYSKQLIKQNRQYIKIKWFCSKYSIYIIPFIRSIVNFINFVIVITEYTKWYENNNHLSNWTKYFAFILIWFYIPNFKANGVHVLWLMMSNGFVCIYICTLSSQLRW